MAQAILLLCMLLCFATSQQNNFTNHYFDLVVVPGDCDYSEVVQTYEPDMVLFDGGIDSVSGRASEITNTNTHPEVIKAGILRIDLHSPMRINSFYRMEQWGVQTFFNYCFRRQESPPAWADQMIYLPLWLNDDLFKDYGENKIVPVGLIGAGFFMGHSYPWRRAVGPLVMEHLPIVHSPRPSFARQHGLVGERYARLLNSTQLSLGCGGATKLGSAECA